MKKFMLLTLAVGLLVLSGCVKRVDNDQDIDCDLYPNLKECRVADPDNPQPGFYTVLDELPTEPITVEFWHVYGQEKGALLQNYIDEFQELYPNITIDAEEKGDYDDLRLAVISAMSEGNTPTMVVAYPDHIAGYLTGDAVIALDDFIYDDVWGIDVDDFVPSYIEENRQYQGGFMYSMPYSKSTEMMVFNKTYLEANGITIPIDEPLTYEQLEDYTDIMVGDGPNQCDYLMNYDSSANFFINSVRMWDGGYTNSEGDILVDDAKTVEMLHTMKGYFESKTMTLPLIWLQDYGSNNFKAGDVCMTIGSTAGIGYNVPGPNTFEIGVAPVPQYDLNNMSAVQQGPNVGIMEDTTDAERLAAWLFIKYITDTEQTAKWSMLTGYLPVRVSGFESELYQEFLSIPTIEDLDNHVFSDELVEFLSNDDGVANPANFIYEAMTANAAFSQADYFDYDPAFVANNTSSSDARLQAGIAMESIFSGNATVEDAIDEMRYQLGIRD